jgi:hypothetical protein
MKVEPEAQSRRSVFASGSGTVSCHRYEGNVTWPAAGSRTTAGTST